jgi:hypothetical protein
MLTGPKRKPRTYRIVGPQRQMDEREFSHPRANRGEFGERIRLGRKNRSEENAFRRSLGTVGEMKGGAQQLLAAHHEAGAGGKC